MIEVTFRTAEAPAAIAAIAREVPQVVVGAGTLLRAAEVAKARPLARGFGQPRHDAGARRGGAGGRHAVSPRHRDAVGGGGAGARDQRHEAVSWPRLWAASGSQALLAPVFPGVAFCPTGGVDERAPATTALPNVPMVGGSWMAPRDAIAAGDWGRIRRLAERAAAIGRREAA